MRLGLLLAVLALLAQPAGAQPTCPAGQVVDLPLMALTVSAPESFSACNSITATDTRIASTVTFLAGSFVALADGFSVDAGVDFTVEINPAFFFDPRLLLVGPNFGAQGTQLGVTVDGENTNFQAGVSMATFGAGISVDAVTVQSSTRLDANLTIAANAAPGPRTVGVETAGEMVDLQSGFAVVLRDLTAPSLTILGPTGGSTVFVSRPTIDITFSDASGVDLTTLAFTADAAPLPVNCALSGSSGNCTPTTDLTDGSVQISASLSDVFGNPATTQVTFNVDTIPVDVTITSPAGGLITLDADVQVTGTVSAGTSAVEINGVPASLVGLGFDAMVPLEEGLNMVVAVASRANGRTGTDSIDVTRDVFAPTVRIDSPRDGLVSVENLIAVTGLVNDIVNGATEATVEVNGIAAAVDNGAFMVMDIPLAPGPNTLEVVATDAVGNEGRHSITVHFQNPSGTRIGIVSGNGQSAPVMAPLAEPLVVRTTDLFGNPAAARTVTFEVSRNSGTLGDQQARTLQATTDANGQASATFTLGDTSGEGNNRVRVTGVGIVGEVEFCATGQPDAADKILMVSGDNQRGLVGHPLANPLEALVIDEDGNPLEAVEVTFSVVEGSGNLDGSSNSLVNTGSDGIARAVLTLGPASGVNNNVVKATFSGLASLAASFTSSGLAPGNPAATSFGGVVLDNALTPIPDALVSIDLNTASTDAEGKFTLTGVPVGHIILHIDPTASPRPETFPQLEFETVTVAGQDNTLGQPILIPALQTDSSQIVGGPSDVVLTMPGVAGLTLTVFANSTTFAGGAPTGQLTISQVHFDKVPMPPPSGTIFMPPAWTIQPAGVTFDPPARITIPNDGLPPGRVIDIFQFDHALNQFINVGKGSVSDDGSIITSDPGFGITRAGWGGCGLPPPPTTCTLDCGPCKIPNAACTGCMPNPTIVAICASAEARGMCGSPCEGVGTGGLTLGGCWSHEIGGVETCYWDFMGPGAPNGGHPMLCCDATPHCMLPGGGQVWGGGAAGNYQCTQIVPAGSTVSGATCNPGQCAAYGPI